MHKIYVINSILLYSEYQYHL